MTDRNDYTPEFILDNWICGNKKDVRKLYKANNYLLIKALDEGIQFSLTSEAERLEILAFCQKEV